MIDYNSYVLPQWDDIIQRGLLPAPGHKTYNEERIKWALANPELFAQWPLGKTIPRHQGYWLRLMKDYPEIALMSPVDHGKSFVTGFIYTLWEIARNLNTRIALIGYNDDVLCGVLRNMQHAIEYNDQLHLFGIRKDTDQKRWTENLFYIDRPDKSIKDATCIVLGRGSVIENRRIDVACFPGYTEIELLNGSKRIDEIQIGDIVRTHTGKFQKVTQIMKRTWYGTTVTIKTRLAEITCTPEHPFLIDGAWKKAKDINLFDNLYRPENPGEQKHFITSFKATYHNCKTVTPIRMGPAFGKFLGYYCAEGCVKNKNNIAFTFNKTEKDYQNFVIDFGRKHFGEPNIDEHKETATTIIFHSSAVAKKFGEICGVGAHHKKIPDVLFRTDDMTKASFILALLEGDGSFDKSDYCTFGVVSKELTEGLQKLLASLSISTSTIRESISTSDWSIGSTCYSLGIKQSNIRKLRSVASEAHGYEVLSIEASKPNTTARDFSVYNMEVENDNSYIANGFAVHNCIDDIINWKDYIKGMRIHNNLCNWFLEQVVPRFRTTKIKIIGSPQADMDFYEWLRTGEFEGEKIASDMKVVAFSSLVEKEQRFDIYDNERDSDDNPPLHLDITKVFDDNKEYIDTLESLWPEAWPVKKLIPRLKRVGKRAACKKYLMIRMSDVGNMFSTKSVEQCKSKEYTLPILPDKVPNGTEVFFGLDPSTGDGSSDCSLFILGLKDGLHYPIDIIAGKYKFPEIKDILWKSYLLWKPVKILVENNACQKWLLQDLANEVKYSVMPIEGHYTGSRKWDPMEGVPYIGALLDNKKIVIPDVTEHDKEKMKDFIYELRVFPAGKKTDIVMSLYLAECAILLKETFQPISFASPFNQRALRAQQWDLNKKKVLDGYCLTQRR